MDCFIFSSLFLFIGLFSQHSEGEKKTLTWRNKSEYGKLLLAFRKKEFKVQCDAIRRGLATVVPLQLLSLFTWQELEVQVCGRPKMDVELLKKNTEYEGCSASDSHIQVCFFDSGCRSNRPSFFLSFSLCDAFVFHFFGLLLLLLTVGVCLVSFQFFWEILKNKFDDIERAKFLKFVWGRSRLPVRSQDFASRFKIQTLEASGNPDNFMPISHTCFFSIGLLLLLSFLSFLLSPFFLLLLFLGFLSLCSDPFFFSLGFLLLFRTASLQLYRFVSLPFVSLFASCLSFPPLSPLLARTDAQANPVGDHAL
jgi:hypothetical protein